MPKFRVLIVDDSSLSREVLKRTLEFDDTLTVVGEATTGEEAVARVRSLRPDLITMDLNMPGMGGLKAIEVVMRERPTPIVVISERSSTSGVDLNYEAISRGALELVPKSQVFGAGDDDLHRFVERMRMLAEAGIEDEKPAPAAPAPPIPVSTERPLLLGIGASTGGPKALARLLSSLPRDFPLPIAIVQHMAEDFFDSFVRFLRDSSGHRVEQANAATTLEAGRVYVAPPRQELFVRENLTVKLLPPPPNALISPSVDSLFFSMATALKGRGMGVLMTGMGDDGAQGLLRMRRMGARTIVQDRASCAVYGMPKAAVELGAAEHIVPLNDLGTFITQTLRDSTAPVAAPPPQPSRSNSVPALQRHVDSVSALPAVQAKKVVLVVDDHAASLETAKDTLSRAGYEVLTLDNPMLLASTLRRHPVSLLILDPELKTMKAPVLLSAVRAHGLGQTPVLLWSTSDSVALAARARECQTAHTLRKGDNAELIRSVGRLTAPKN